MPHPRQNIRAAVASILTAALPNFKVYASRKYSVNESELPCIDMRFLNESSQLDSMDRNLMRTASLYMRATINVKEADADNDLDDVSLAIENAMNATDAFNTLRGLCLDYYLNQTNFSDSADGDRVTADMVLRYDFIYETAT